MQLGNLICMLNRSIQMLAGATHVAWWGTWSILALVTGYHSREWFFLRKMEWNAHCRKVLELINLGTEETMQRWPYNDECRWNTFQFGSNCPYAIGKHYRYALKLMHLSFHNFVYCFMLKLRDTSWKCLIPFLVVPKRGILNRS